MGEREYYGNENILGLLLLIAALHYARPYTLTLAVCVALNVSVTNNGNKSFMNKSHTFL